MLTDYDKESLIVNFIDFYKKKQNEVLSKTKFQKLIFFVQFLGVPLDYDFEIYYYGPYSKHLNSQLYNLYFENYIEIEKARTQSGSDINLGEKAKYILNNENINKYLKTIDKVLENFSSENSYELGIYATIVMVYNYAKNLKEDTNKELNKDEIIDIVRKIKSIDDKNIKNKIDYLNKLDLGFTIR